jgi:FAD:protein FMN transferase
MPKTFTDLSRHALNGATMGTRWSALFHAPADFDPGPPQVSMQAAVDQVDRQMSTWKADSDLMRFNRMPAGIWVALPPQILEVLAFGLDVGRASDGAFDIGMGDAVTAWGFGAKEANPDDIRKALRAVRRPAHDLLELDIAGGKARKHGALALDLSGIAKGYGVDRLAAVARNAGLDGALLSIDGELVAIGHQPDGSAWTVAVEEPDYESRAPHSILELEDAAVATSGDYRHWIDVNGKRLSHTMDPRKGGPLMNAPASVTVVAQTCMAADAWATALMVLGEQDGMALARDLGLDALYLMRDGGGFSARACGPLFEGERLPDLS